MEKPRASRTPTRLKGGIRVRLSFLKNTLKRRRTMAVTERISSGPMALHFTAGITTFMKKPPKNYKNLFTTESTEDTEKNMAKDKSPQYSSTGLAEG
jgi:hypothetical protein